jgi:hypothetical protein
MNVSLLLISKGLLFGPLNRKPQQLSPIFIPSGGEAERRHCPSLVEPVAYPLSYLIRGKTLL